MDINNNTVVVGTPSDGAYNEGAAYVFGKNGSAWSKQARLIAANRSNGGSNFGTSVFVLGDRALIGAIDSVGGVSYCGAVHEFIRQGTVWTEQSRLFVPQNPSDREFLDYYGHCVAQSGEYIIAGALSDNQKATDAGAAYIYMNCTYILAGDLNEDCQADMGDLEILASAWLSIYNLNDFSSIAGSWGLDCFDTPTPAICTE